MIPLIIHQTWKTSDLPPEFARCQQTWQDLHPDFEYKLHTDEDNLRLVAGHYPSWFNIYQGFPHDIQRADMARVMWLHYEGGIYADMDLEAFKSVLPLMDRETLFDEPEPHPFDEENVICNFVMIADRGSSFMYRLVLEMTKPYDYRGKYHANAVCETTGPLLVTKVFKQLLQERWAKLPRVMRNCWTAQSNQEYGHHHFASTWHSR